MKKIKPVNTEKYEFENPIQTVLKACSVFRFIEDFLARIETTDVLSESPLSSVNVSIANVMKEIKPVVPAKHEFENRDESKLLIVFEIFELSVS